MGFLLTIGLLTLAWAVATCMSNCEALATRGLVRQGIATYHPRFRAGVVVKPLFPGYLFVFAQNGWRSVLGTRGIIGLIMNDGKPVLLSDSVVESVRDLEGREGFVELPDPPFKPGVKVRVTRGSLVDLEGICDMVDERRVFVLLKFLGQEIRARFEKADLVLA